MESALFLKSRHVTTPGGFTLIEMLVVVAIIGVLLSVVTVSRGSFNRSLLLTDTAYTVALSVRSTQTLGLSSKQFNAVPNAGFGIHFGSDPKVYTQFADITRGSVDTSSWCYQGTTGLPDAKPGDCLFDTTSLTEQVQQYNLTNGFSIKKICAYGPTAALIACSNGSLGLTAIDVVYQRPNTTAFLSATINNTPTPISSACVELQPPGSDAVRGIKITQLGSVSVISACP